MIKFMFGLLVGMYLGLEVYETLSYSKKQLNSYYERIMDK